MLFPKQPILGRGRQGTRGEGTGGGRGCRGEGGRHSPGLPSSSSSSPPTRCCGGRCPEPETWRKPSPEPAKGGPMAMTLLLLRRASSPAAAAVSPPPPPRSAPRRSPQRTFPRGGGGRARCGAIRGISAPPAGPPAPLEGIEMSPAAPHAQEKIQLQCHPPTKKILFRSKGTGSRRGNLPKSSAGRIGKRLFLASPLAPTGRSAEGVTPAPALGGARLPFPRRAPQLLALRPPWVLPPSPGRGVQSKAPFFNLFPPPLLAAAFSH